MIVSMKNYSGLTFQLSVISAWREIRNRHAQWQLTLRKYKDISQYRQLTEKRIKIKKIVLKTFACLSFYQIRLVLLFFQLNLL